MKAEQRRSSWLHLVLRRTLACSLRLACRLLALLDEVRSIVSLPLLVCDELFILLADCESLEVIVIKSELVVAVQIEVFDLGLELFLELDFHNHLAACE